MHHMIDIELKLEQLLLKSIAKEGHGGYFASAEIRCAELIDSWDSNGLSKAAA